MSIKSWNLEDALKLVRPLQEETKKFSYHITLGGSVLNVGYSEKDLDLYFHPIYNETPLNPDGLVKWLESLWGQGHPIMKDYPEREPNKMEPIKVAIPPPKSYQDFVRAYNDQANINQWISYDFETTHAKPPEKTAYKFSLKFIRPGNDRIDVFIL